MGCDTFLVGGSPEIAVNITLRRCLPVLLSGALCLVASAAVLAECTDCHDLDEDAYAFGAHGVLDCTDCHFGGDEVPHEEGSMEADCSMCHDDAVSGHAEGVHRPVDTVDAIARPTCVSCHGDPHSLVSHLDPASPVNATRLASTCSGCHADPEILAQLDFPIARPLEAYESSVHAVALSGGTDAATCNDCHGSHAVFPAHDSRSSVFHATVPDTCGACHEDIVVAYRESVHGQATAAGIREAPVCTDCHGEHRILSPLERGSPVYATNIPKMICGRCHSSVTLKRCFCATVLSACCRCVNWRSGTGR